MKMPWEMALVHHKFLPLRLLQGCAKKAVQAKRDVWKRLPYHTPNSKIGFMRPADCPVDQSFRAVVSVRPFLAWRPVSLQFRLDLSITAKFNFSRQKRAVNMSEKEFL